MDTQWLETFVAAAEAENFRQAAEKLHLAQPTVSLHIDKLEQQLGVPLFERSGRGVRLGEHGRRFLPYAQSVLADLQSGQTAVARLAQGYDQTLAIAVSPLIAATYLPRWIQGFLRDYPNVEVAVHVMESTDIAQAIADAVCDLGFSRMPSQLSRIESLPLYDDPVVVVAPAGPHDLDGPPRTLEELLATYPLLTHNHPLYWDDILASLRQQFGALRSMRVSQVHVTLRWIEEDMGFSFLPKSTVRRTLLLGSAVEVPVPESFSLPVARTYLLHDARVVSVVGRAFCGFVQAYMDQRRV